LNISDIFTRVDKLSIEEARKILDEKDGHGATLLDVREPAEYKSGHIPGARFIPLSNLPDNTSTLDASEKIIAYCKRGPRSRSAAALLRRQGFNDVYYMDGGIDAWNGLVASGHYEAGLFLLEGKRSLEDLILLAWSLEEGTGRFYYQMKELVKDNGAKGIFESLAKAEHHHKSKVRESYRHITGNDITDKMMQEKSLKGYMEGGVSIEEAVGWIDKENAALQDILELSKQIEINSLDLYMKMQMEVENELAKTSFNDLIEEEKTHLSRLGKLLDSKL
jgi:rhodanese-related sulfurtransferase/rubrerythrin